MDQSPAITYTQAATDALKDVLSDINVPGAKIRIYVAGGGCSGLQYGMAVDENVEETDEQFVISDVPTLIDKVSLKYLSGSEVDYLSDMIGGGFKFNNPHATKACGCSNSFSVEDDTSDVLDTDQYGGCHACPSKNQT